MLKLKYLFENFDLAKNCIQYWEHDPASLSETLGWFRISSNAIYPFRQGDGLCFLRLCPAAEKQLADVADEIAVIRWLRQAGFAAMEPVPMKDGRDCALLTTPWGDYVASCFRQVNGQPVEDTPASAAIVTGYGRCLGQLHRLLESCPHGQARRGHEAWLDEAQARMMAAHAPLAMVECLREARCQLAKLPRTETNYGLIHYDFEPDNVFVQPERGQFSVIDFDDMMHGWHALDVVRALNGLEELPPGDAPLTRQEKEELFLAGYRSQHTFTPAEEAALPLMRRLVQLTEYAGLLYVLEEDVPDAPEWMVHLRSRLTAKLRWLEGQLLG